MKFTKKQALDYFLIMVGTSLLAIAVIQFWVPYDMVTGGVSGLAIIINDYSGQLGWAVPVWLTNLAINIPLFIIGYKSIPREYLFRSAFAALFTTFALWAAEFIPVPESDILLAAVFGGLICGLGVGLVLRAMSTTGGTTLAAVIIKKIFLKHIPVARVIFGLDAAIILVGLFVFGPVAVMYAIISVFIISKVTEVMIEGLSFGKCAFIISTHNEEIAEKILKDMDRGCTAIESRGMFTQENRPMLLCVVSPKEITQIKQIVYNLDERAFLFVSDVREVLGEGFKDAREHI